MKLVAATALALLFAGCQDLRAQRQSEVAAPDAARIEARIIGLTEEVDRLARRVAALEGRGGAPVAGPSPSLRPEATPAAGTPASPFPVPPPATSSAGAPAAVTGILIDARSAETDGEKRPAGTRHDRWRVLDFDGGTVFCSDDLPESLRRVVPVFWLAGPADEMSPDMVQTVGASPREVAATYAEVLAPTEGPGESLFYLDAGAVSRVRSIPDLRRLLSAGRVAIVLDR
ncbi:MAG: hypothetical protein MUE73_03470 [Planctomycetes bacterium]|jgi:hypothetical protein|nr:hypothetical protein [Planctomycetota bacterium]